MPLDGPFIGSEALARGLVKKHHLRSRYQAVFPDVYLPEHLEPTLAHRTRAAWLWSRRRGVVAGAAAAGLHGAQWIPDDEPIELVWSNARPPTGLVTRRDRLQDGEVQWLRGLPVTTPVRTAFDIGRLTRGERGIARLDALGNVSRFDPERVLELADRHAGSPGVPRLRAALALHDRGAESPRETWLRLLLVGAGHPKPRTQIPVFDNYGRPRYYLDMGWEDVMVAVEYDGQHHRERTVFSNDIIRAEFIAERGWRCVRVVAGQRPAEILDRVARTRASGVRPDRRIS
ncbi:Uncharacterised protein [Mycolicibacterium vanbaalenii]|uniref:DUF559 domain-containing protein n=1 Tax=Mycolicibacterium vanbaalenii TaxID=110539 RepID=A0A5S9R869_MYCVN|nr:hypothetical protein [Mycolicibacterium vanbaalenii]CAA0132081.1 Uncharacterised protein [Mycolicibacterium vanbaalenii]